MSLFLFKPHVEGSKGQVTTPDVVVDRVFLDDAWKPVNGLTSELVHHVESGETAAPGYALTAIGGGVLISPAILLGPGRMVIARRAWRLRDLDGHVDRVALNGRPLAEIHAPADLLAKAGGREGVLPRGIMAVCAAPEEGPSAELHDPVRERSLPHEISLIPVDDDQWGGSRPNPRYSVGPTQQEVTHYI